MKLLKALCESAQLRFHHPGGATLELSLSPPEEPQTSANISPPPGCKHSSSTEHTFSHTHHQHWIYIDVFNSPFLEDFAPLPL